MNETFGLLSLIPPVAAIGLALWKKQLLSSLFVGILLGEIILDHGRVFKAFFGLLDHCLRTAGQKSNMELIVFSVLVGSLLALIREANGFRGFIARLEARKRPLRRTGVFFMTYLIGVSILLENWSNILINGTTMKPLYDRLGVERERLAYFTHTVSINFIALAVVNSWGAFYMSLLQAQGEKEPIRLIIRSIPFNFYCLASLVLVAVVMATGLTVGPMKKAARGTPGERRPDESAAAVAPDGQRFLNKTIPPRALYMIMPIVTLVAVLFASLYVTGKGNLLKGSGSTAVFYAVIIAILLLGGLLLVRKLMNLTEVLDVLFKGMGEFLQVGVFMVFALTLGDLCRQLGTGTYIAGLAHQHVPVFLLPALVFLLGCVMSFATGTSYGTFSIMIPIALPIASAAGINPALMLAACLSGGVFGDNCSPVSDTSIVTSMGAGCSVVDHVRTQLPYALISASVAVALFIAAGLIM